MALENELRAVHLENFQDGDQKLVNGDELFSKESSQNVPLKEERVIKKAKRLTKLSPRKDEHENGSLSPPVNSGKLPFSKNSRKSRNGDRSRGQPKKGGAGGKGTWGAPGSELYESGECVDNHDPNYDSDSQDKVILDVVKPCLDRNGLMKVVEPILREYLEHGDSKEAKALLTDLNMVDADRQRVLELAVNLAMDRHDPQRELMSRLLRTLHGEVLHTTHMSQGFDGLLEGLADLTLDTPDAPSVLGQFIARAVADECLPAKFISHYKGSVDSEYVRNALEKADVLLSMTHGIAKLDNVWGVGGGNIPVKYLSNKMVLLLKEYLSSGDMAEATRCLRELDVPHFKHELVYQAAVIAIEESSDRSSDKIVDLLKSLSSSNIVTPDQFRKGVKRVFADMPEICLDVPAAYALLERLGNKLHTVGVMPDDLHKEMPVRGRKRFVSEGDGGKVKVSDPFQY